MAAARDPTEWSTAQNEFLVPGDNAIGQICLPSGKLVEANLRISNEAGKVNSQVPGYGSFVESLFVSNRRRISALVRGGH